MRHDPHAGARLPTGGANYTLCEVTQCRRFEGEAGTRRCTLHEVPEGSTDTGWKIDRFGAGTSIATHYAAGPWKVMLLGSRGNWTAEAWNTNKRGAGIIRGRQVTVAGTQQQACAAAFAVRFEANADAVKAGA